MDTALYPGTFDPITLGHVDIMKRAKRIFNNLIVAVADNPEKQPLFTVQERIEIIKEATREMDGITVSSFSELTARYAKSINALVIIRGLRAVSDFEFEFQMALMNRKIEPTVETVFLMPNEKYSYLSSSLIKDIARRGGDISCFVPDIVKEKLAKRFSK
ncbi:MAG TPA: pantetheine-phosphate adenylyltransferase [candidate division Zixibacteria bacterium]|nr:pantetheine-phosphate adenylyltransferase [candidate division Zixibacteria bacterium]